MKTLQNLIDLAKNRIDEVDVDTQIDTIIKEAINFAYIFKASKLEKQFSTNIGVVINGIVTLPDDMVNIEKITPALQGGEYKKGNTLFTNQDDGTTYTIVYAVNRTPLINTTQTVDCSDRMKYALVTYACYVYQEYRKRQQIASMYLGEYQSIISEIEFDSICDDSVDAVKDVIFTDDTEE